MEQDQYLVKTVSGLASVVPYIIRHSLPHWYPMGVLFEVPCTPPPIQLPTTVSGKAEEDGLCA